jgi:hypothetical protein
MYKIMKRRSVTLTEVIVGAVILATTFGGLLATFVGVQRYIVRANKRLVSANLGRSVLDTLYVGVRADTWDSTDLSLPLSIGEHTSPPGIGTGIDIGIHTYTGSYLVSAGDDVDGDGQSDYRQVDVSVNYPVE